jgi:hypothetical protein
MEPERRIIMAYMVTFQSDKADVIVNMEKVTYVRGGSDKYCTIYFGGDQSVNVDASALEVLGIAQNGTMIPSQRS